MTIKILERNNNIKGAVALRRLCNKKEMTQILKKGLSHFCFHGIINKENNTNESRLIIHQ